MTGPLYTIGHGTAGPDELLSLLRGAAIEAVVDVRTAPGSRRNPEMARGEMSRWLPEGGVGYSWEKRLGGWRKAARDGPDTGLRNAAFAGYAEHMRTPEFRSAIDSLLAGAEARPTAVLCAETVWWRCHRRMVADFVQLIRGREVRHLMHDGSQQAHRPTDVARPSEAGDALVYPDE